MGFKYTQAVYLCPLPATQKIVLWVLAEHADNETGICWPGQSRIAHFAGMNYSTAQRNLDKVIDLGLVKITGKHLRKGSNKLFTNEYTLDLPAIIRFTGSVKPPVDDSVGGEPPVPPAGDPPTASGSDASSTREPLVNEPTVGGAPPVTDSGEPTVLVAESGHTVGGAPDEYVLIQSSSSHDMQSGEKAGRADKTKKTKTANLGETPNPHTSDSSAQLRCGACFKRPCAPNEDVCFRCLDSSQEDSEAVYA